MEIPQALIDLHSQADRLRAEIKVLEKTFEQAEQRSVSPGLPAPDYGLRRLVAIAIMPVACGSGGWLWGNVYGRDQGRHELIGEIENRLSQGRKASPTGGPASGLMAVDTFALAKDTLASKR